MVLSTDTIRPTHGFVLNDPWLVYHMLEAQIDCAKTIENRCFGFAPGWYVVSLARKTTQHTLEHTCDFQRRHPRAVEGYDSGRMHGVVYISHALKQHEINPPSAWQDLTGRWGMANIISKRLLVKNGPRVRGNFGAYPLGTTAVNVYAAVDKALSDGACIEETHAETRWPAGKATTPTPKRRPPKTSLVKKAATAEMPAVTTAKPSPGAIRKRSSKVGTLKQTTLTATRRVE